MVPGHEIVGRIIQTGAAVNKFKINDVVGVSCPVALCRNYRLFATTLLYLSIYLNLLRTAGTMVLVGISENLSQIQLASLITKKRILVGSLIGGIRETQEMLDYCAEKNISVDVEIISIQKISEAYERMIKAYVTIL